MSEPYRHASGRFYKQLRHGPPTGPWRNCLDRMRESTLPVAEFNHDRIVVRRQAYLEMAVRHLLREILRDLTLGALDLLPIYVGQYGIAAHAPCRRHQDMVDAAVGPRLRIEGIERTVRGMAFCSSDI